jgi:hypothetical protein
MKKLAALTIAGVLALGAFGGSIAHATHVDQSACEVARAAKAVGIINEARRDLKGGAAERREASADLRRAAQVVASIEAVCEPDEGSQGGGEGE